MVRAKGGVVPQDKAVPESASGDSNEFDVGQRLRRIRLARKLTLSKVATSAGISEGFLSQIERGVGNASIATLRSVAGVLGVEMRDLFDESTNRTNVVLSWRDRPVLSFGDMGTKYLLTPALDRNLEVFITELNPHGTTSSMCSVTQRSCSWYWTGRLNFIWLMRCFNLRRGIRSPSGVQRRILPRRPAESWRSCCSLRRRQVFDRAQEVPTVKGDERWQM